MTEDEQLKHLSRLLRVVTHDVIESGLTGESLKGRVEEVLYEEGIEEISRNFTVTVEDECKVKIVVALMPDLRDINVTFNIAVTEDPDHVSMRLSDG